MDKAKKKEKYDCENCLEYEWIDDEVGWQCRYAFNPPCDTQH